MTAVVIDFRAPTRSPLIEFEAARKAMLEAFRRLVEHPDCPPAGRVGEEIFSTANAMMQMHSLAEMERDK